MRPPLSLCNLCGFIVAAAGLLGMAPHSLGVITAGGLNLKPMDSYVGQWGLGTAVAVGKRTILSAAHLGGEVGEAFVMDGKVYQAVSVSTSPDSDLMRITLDTDLPGYYPIATSLKRGAKVLVAGFGATGTSRTSSGLKWGDGGQEVWGANTLDAVGAGQLAFRFDKSGGASEAGLGVGDSGGAIFVQGRGGSLQLAGIATSISGRFGVTRYGDWSYAVNLTSQRGFLGGAAVAVPSGGTASVLGSAGVMLLRRRRPR